MQPASGSLLCPLPSSSRLVHLFFFFFLEHPHPLRFKNFTAPTSSIPQRNHAMAVNKTIYVVTTAEGISTIHSTQDAANTAANALEGASVEEHELR